MRIGRRPAVWFAAAFLILIAATQLTTWWVVRSLSRDFDTRADHHLSGDVQHVRDRVANIERHLDATAARLQTRLTAARNGDRATLFRILSEEVHTRTGRGARIVTATGLPIAWWGDDLPFEGNRRYLFDVTNLYIVWTRDVSPLRVEAFAR